MGILDTTPPRSLGWTTTRWSMVGGLQEPSQSAREASWAYLSEAYRRPMEVYARRLLGRMPTSVASAGDADEVVQDFLATCLEKGWLSRADPEQGRFRAYVQVLLRRHVHRWVRHKMAGKRHPGAGAHLLPLLPGDEEVAPHADPQDVEAFDRSWTDIAVARALERLRNQYPRDHAVIRDLIDTEGSGSPDMPERLGVRHAQFPVVKRRARERFGDLFREELADTVHDEEALAEEWKTLAPYLP